MAYIGSTSIWEIARPHMEELVGQTHESSSIAQLDGSDRRHEPDLWQHDDGMGAQLSETDLGRLRQAGVMPLPVDEGLALFDAACASSLAALTCSP